MKTQFIVHCWLDAEKIIGVSKKDFAIGIRKGIWVKRRLRIFKNYTLRSLLNQSFDNFRIFLFCGRKFQHITKNFNLETDRVEKIYDYGERAYQEMEANRVSIMRIDSDDMFHQKMMEDVRTLVLADRQKMFSARLLVQWNILHNFVTDIKIPVSPFTNNVLPKSVYKNFDLLKKRQFMGYRSAPELIPDRRVCIIRHKQNVTWPRINKNPGSDHYRREEMAKRNNIILDRSKIIRVLKDYGVSADDVPMGK